MLRLIEFHRHIGCYNQSGLNAFEEWTEEESKKNITQSV